MPVGDGNTSQEGKATKTQSQRTRLRIRKRSEESEKCAVKREKRACWPERMKTQVRQKTKNNLETMRKWNHEWRRGTGCVLLTEQIFFSDAENVISVRRPAARTHSVDSNGTRQLPDNNNQLHCSSLSDTLLVWLLVWMSPNRWTGVFKPLCGPLPRDFVFGHNRTGR